MDFSSWSSLGPTHQFHPNKKYAIRYRFSWKTAVMTFRELSPPSKEIPQAGHYLALHKEITIFAFFFHLQILLSQTHVQTFIRSSLGDGVNDPSIRLNLFKYFELMFSPRINENETLHHTLPLPTRNSKMDTAHTLSQKTTSAADLNILGIRRLMIG